MSEKMKTFLNMITLKSLTSVLLPCLPTQGIEAPVNTDKDHLIQLILGHQARVLTERAQKAIRQLHTHQDHVDDVLSIDASTLQPPSTAYSTRGNQLNQSSTGSSPGSAGQTAASVTADIRSRVKQQMKLRKVCVCHILFT